MKNKHKHFGSSKAFGGKDISFPKHLTPEIIHSALFVYNAPKEEVAQRVEYCAKQIGDEAMSYAMAMLMLPTLMNSMAQSNEYKDWQQSRIKTLN
jgi:hypothetical protein|tara:strand:- start:4 stop:288 length:285 start_codon:yes stop_codon:yes gene_type:complete